VGEEGWSTGRSEKNRALRAAAMSDP